MTGPAELAPARKVFWRLVRERAGSPQAIRDAFVEAGHDLTDGAVGRWIRGETDPGWEVTLWASRRWDVSLDELAKGQALERTFADRLADHERRLTEVQEWLRELYSSLGLEMGAAVSTEDAPNLALARLRREMAELRERVERRLGGE